ncbi:50S ribosomal protein L18 [Candidatus Bathyarchaeota archaeon]|nr:50S ribosomal protein L18 [Candidatus Bathyarchaeota archaeon]
MAKGPSYRVHFRRRREGKTNYYLRRNLLLSGKNRVVIRPSVKNIVCQVVDAHLKGDIILTSATSKELEKKYDWKFGRGNVPAAYLTGYLLGKKALKVNAGDCIADIGLRVHLERTYAALKGVIDAGMDVPHSGDVFPDEERLKGKHIENFAKVIKDKKPEEEDSSPFDNQFSAYKKAGVDPSKISSQVDAILKKIDKEYA